MYGLWSDKLILKVDNEQEKFHVKTTVEKSFHNGDGRKVEEEVKDHERCPHRKWKGGIFENIKDEKGDLQVWRIWEVDNDEHCV